MLHQIRRYLRVLAATVLVSASALGGWSTIAHGLECHAAECLPSVVAHDESAHAFRGAPAPGAERGINCVLCHWSRAFGLGAPPASAAPSIVSRSLFAPAVDASVARLLAVAQPSLRAPPSASSPASPA